MNVDAVITMCLLLASFGSVTSSATYMSTYMLGASTSVSPSTPGAPSSVTLSPAGAAPLVTPSTPESARLVTPSTPESASLVTTSTPESAPLVTPSTPESAYSGQATIERNYTDSLADNSSMEFKRLKSSFENELDSVYGNEPGYVRSEVLSFRNGSIIVDFEVIFNSTAMVNCSYLEKVLVKAIDDGNGTLGNFTVDRESVKICTLLQVSMSTYMLGASTSVSPSTPEAPSSVTLSPAGATPLVTPSSPESASLVTTSTPESALLVTPSTPESASLVTTSTPESAPLVTPSTPESAPLVTPSTPESACSGQATIARNYTDSLADNSSMEFKRLKSSFENELDSVYGNEPGYVRSEVLSFRNGSIIVDFAVIFNSTAMVNCSYLEKLLVKAIDDGNGTLGNFTVDRESVKICTLLQVNMSTCMLGASTSVSPSTPEAPSSVTLSPAGSAPLVTPSTSESASLVTTSTPESAPLVTPSTPESASLVTTSTPESATSVTPSTPESAPSVTPPTPESAPSVTPSTPESVPSVTPSTSESAYSGQATIERNYTDSLADKSSKEFITLKSSIENELDSVYRKEPGYVRSEVLSFRSGSIIFVFEVIFNSTAMVNSSYLQEVLVKAIDEGNGTLGNFTVDRESVTVKQKSTPTEPTVTTTEQPLTPTEKVVTTQKLVTLYLMIAATCLLIVVIILFIILIKMIKRIK